MKIAGPTATLGDEARFRAFMAASSGAVYRMSPDWSKMREVAGHALPRGDGQPGVSWLERYIHLDDHPVVRAAIDHAIRTKTAFELEHRVIRADGSQGWTASRAVPILAADGEIEEWIGTANDVTDRCRTVDSLGACEETLAVLLLPSDSRLPESPDAIQKAASSLPGEARGAGRVGAAVERERAEVALRESEQRFAQFAASSSDILWIRRADDLTMEYVSPAFESIYGIDPGAVMGGVERWGGLILPEDRMLALEHIERARAGETLVHEFRIKRPSDGAFRWIRDHDFPLRDAAGRVQRIGGIATDVTEARLAAEHQSVLLAELQHRVRNLMALIRSMAARTAGSATGVEDYASRLSGRLLTLARVQALLTRSANAGADLAIIVRDELTAAAGHEAHCEITGPPIVLPPKAAELITLAMHELATNAVKYGALSPRGIVRVSWRTIERGMKPWLRLDWKEEGAPERPGDPSTPRRSGFGSELIEARVPYELGGRGRLEIATGGARAELEFPLKAGDSILETDAPKATTVLGGALDMTGEADLSGQRILVLEDDYYLASDTARTLRGAGAEVIGPYPTTEAALKCLDDETPTLATVDIILGGGVSFEVARALKLRAVPFVFITGYDQAVIPAEFDKAPRLQKPIELRDVVRALAGTISSP